MKKFRSGYQLSTASGVDVIRFFLFINRSRQAFEAQLTVL
jgi:hypothetical protein